MVEIFKNWVSMMLCIGIFVTFIQLIIPKTNLKKYIYSLIGIVTILTVISPVINLLKDKNVEQSVQQVLANISGGENMDTSQIDKEKYKNAQEAAVKDGFIQSMKNDIKSRLLTKNITVKSVEINIDEAYNIEKVEVRINKLANSSTIESVNKVVEYINKEYDINYSKISVIEEAN